MVFQFSVKLPRQLHGELNDHLELSLNPNDHLELSLNPNDHLELSLNHKS